MEIPNNHHGMLLLDKKNSLALSLARLLFSNPITSENERNAMMMIQSIVLNTIWPSIRG